MLMVDGAPPMSPDGTPAGDGDHVPTPFDYDRDAGRYRLGMRLSRSFATASLYAAISEVLLDAGVTVTKRGALVLARAGC